MHHELCAEAVCVICCCPDTVCRPLLLSRVCVLSNRTEAREELRRQVGTLRFDLNTLASTKPKDAKKDALAARKEFIRAVSVPCLQARVSPCCAVCPPFQPASVGELASPPASCV